MPLAVVLLCSACWGASPAVTADGWVGRPCPPVSGRDFREHTVPALTLGRPAVIWFVSKDQFDRAETLTRALAETPNPPVIYLVMDTSGIPFFISWLVKGKIRERYETLLRRLGLTLTADPRAGAPAPAYPVYYLDDADASVTRLFSPLTEKLGERLTGVAVDHQGRVAAEFQQAPTTEELLRINQRLQQEARRPTPAPSGP